jgi:hypothetical protein
MLFTLVLLHACCYGLSFLFFTFLVFERKHMGVTGFEHCMARFLVRSHNILFCSNFWIQCCVNVCSYFNISKIADSRRRIFSSSLIIFYSFFLFKSLFLTLRAFLVAYNRRILVAIFKVRSSKNNRIRHGRGLIYT